MLNDLNAETEVMCYDCIETNAKCKVMWDHLSAEQQEIVSNKFESTIEKVRNSFGLVLKRAHEIL